MSLRAPTIADSGWQAGDHVSAFYSDAGNSMDDVVVAYAFEGLQAGNKCVCFIDTGVLGARPDARRAHAETLYPAISYSGRAYPHERRFFKEAFLGKPQMMVKEAVSSGYERLWVLGDATHPRIFINEMVIKSPYYVPARQFLDNQ